MKSQKRLELKVAFRLCRSSRHFFIAAVGCRFALAATLQILEKLYHIDKSPQPLILLSSPFQSGALSNCSS